MNQRKTKILKASLAKPPKTSGAPVFPKTLHRLRLNPRKTAPSPKSPKRDNIFSNSRDTRENRGAREMKTKPNSKLLFRICAML